MSGAKTVLVVDDSRMSRTIIVRIISTHFPKWRVIEAGNGEEALAVSDGEHVDIMTLDVNMPGMNGIELGGKLRARFPNAQISLVTANIQRAIRLRAKAANMHFIPKPISEERMVDYLRAASR
jgi:two-component system, chemotaxis family, chemotaxis protein CheY